MPSYTWVCGACTTSNPPGQEDCIACHCPAASSQQLRAQYRAAFEGVGLPVVRAVAPEVIGESPFCGPRQPIFRAGTLCFTAAGVFLGATVVAFILLWGGGPLMTMGGGPTGSNYSHWYWSLPDGLSLGCIAAVLLAPPAALVCALLGFRARGKLSLSSPAGWIVLILVVLFVLSCTV